VKVRRNLGVIYDQHARALAWMEQYTGIPYPWEKFDVFLAPAFQFGGMEHPGAIFYNAGGLFLDTTATQAQRLGRASVIAHETAHLWFGDLVTMRWFDDVWLKEVFANFMAAKIVNPEFPEVNHALRFLLAHYPAAYDVDRSAGTHAIRQPLENLADAGSQYGAIIYQKAPIMMRQLEMLVGEQAFRGGLREYLQRFAFGNATWDDLVAILDARTPADLRAWSAAWVSAPGRPTLTVQQDRRGTSIVQSDPRGRGLVWPQQISVAIGRVRGRATTRAERDLGGRLRPDVLVRGRMSGRRPVRLVGYAADSTNYVLPNADGLAYGNIVLDASSRAWLLARLHTLETPLQRGSALITLWEEMVDGRIPAVDLANILHAVLDAGEDELIVQRALSYHEALWARWLTRGERQMLAATHEATMRRGLTEAATSSAKLAWFRTLSRTALTDSTTAWLFDVWSRASSVPGLALGEEDESSLAMQLAVRRRSDWRAIYDTQAMRITNPDRRARWAFLRDALSPDSASQHAWMRSLEVPENRRREPWVQDGLSLLHHALRTDRDMTLLADAFRLLPEAHRTGDIFFGKRWLDAVLSGHRSVEAATLVRAWLRDTPTLTPRLRALVEQSADELWRVADKATASTP
jgi:aminopeptidase N